MARTALETGDKLELILTKQRVNFDKWKAKIAKTINEVRVCCKSVVKISDRISRRPSDLCSEFSHQNGVSTVWSQIFKVLFKLNSLR